MTAATEQAAFLRALADHLEAHPDLAPVTVGWSPYGDPSLQISIATTDVNALVRWAESVGTTHLRAFDHGKTVHVDVSGALGPVRVRVVDVFPDLAGFGRDHETIAFNDPRLPGGAV